jgi:methyl-accepting chemotaxis protein
MYKTDLNESKKEIREKIADLNQSIQFINNTIKNITVSISEAKSDAHQTTQINNNLGDLVKEIVRINSYTMSSKLKELSFDMNNSPLPTFQSLENDIKDLAETTRARNHIGEITCATSFWRFWLYE